MRKIFLDIGASVGTSIMAFRKYNRNNYEIFSFECDKKNIEIIKSMNLGITLIEKAAWSSDGMIKYYYGNTSSAGTLYPQKTTGGINVNNYYEVETIDLAKFIKDQFIKNDYIICKMNCEGAEYEIIPHLKNNGLIDWIDKWYIQWHYDKIKIDRTKHLAVSQMIPSWDKWDF